MRTLSERPLRKMKILFLSKRRPQGKDLLTRPYGRFFNIPRILSERGHEVCLLLLSYKKEAPSREMQYGMTWITESVFRTGPLAYFQRAERLAKEFKPDWVVGFSDTYYGILAAWLGERHRIRSAIDAYDNYESYIPWLKPLHLIWQNFYPLSGWIRRLLPSQWPRTRAFIPWRKKPAGRNLIFPLKKKLWVTVVRFIGTEEWKSCFGLLKSSDLGTPILISY
jgi:hypothetical protein